MKRLFTLLSLASIFYTYNIYASNSPIPPEQEALNNQFSVKRTLRAVWDSATMGTSTATSYGLGVYLPAKAAITDSYIYVVNQITDSAVFSATTNLGFACGDADNILAATNLTTRNPNTVLVGLQSGGSAAEVGNSAHFITAISAAQNTNPCQVVAHVTNDNASAGLVILYLDYVVGQ